MKNRKLSAILVCVMLLSLLAGCGKGAKDSIESMESDYSKYVTLGQYKGVEYTPQKTEITDEDMEYFKTSLLYQNQTENQIYEGTATEGDTVNIDFTGYVDGTAFEGGSTDGAGYNLVLGSGSFIDDFEQQIEGHSPGDAFDVTVTFPEDYGSEDLAGKDAVFETTLNYIVETIVPEYTDALVASVTDYATIEEYEAAKKAEREASNAENDLATDKSNLVQKVLDSSNVSEYPEGEIENRVNTMMVVWQELESYIKEKMIFLTIANQEGITASQEEADAKVNELLQQTGLTDKETLSQMYGYTDDDYMYEVIYEKVVTFIYDNAVIVEGADDAQEEGGLIDDYGTTEEE